MVSCFACSNMQPLPHLQANLDILVQCKRKGMVCSASLATSGTLPCPAFTACKAPALPAPCQQ